VQGTYRLEVTELEVTTLAFAMITGIIYYLWWNKPLDVHCSVPVYLLKDDEKEKVNSQNTSPVSPVELEDPMDVPPIMPCDLNSNRVDSQSSLISQKTQIPQQTLLVMSDPEPNSQEPSQSSHDNSPTSPGFQSTRMQQFSAFIQRQCQKHGTVLGLAYVFLVHPLFSFFRAFGYMIDSETLDDSTPLRVPTFYSPIFTDYNTKWWSFTIGLCVAIVFGGIHCMAWSFHFPTLQEKLAWRISAASIAGLPIFLSAVTMSIAIGILSENWQDIFSIVLVLMFLTSFILYVIARIVLLVLPCIALRALNPAALVEIQWAAFFPHIG